MTKHVQFPTYLNRITSDGSVMKKRILFLILLPLFVTPFGWGTKLGADVPGLEGGIYDVPEIVCNNNGFCDNGERSELCTKDCTPKPKCFNHWCEYGETPETCPYDCSIPGNNCFIDPPVACPFGWARTTNWTDNYNCQRLGNCILVCNRNGICDGNENVRICPDDCAQVVVDELQKSYALMMQRLDGELQQLKSQAEMLQQNNQKLDSRIQAFVINDNSSTESDSNAFAFVLFFSALGLIGGSVYYVYNKQYAEDIPQSAGIQKPYVPYLKSLFLRTNDQEVLASQLIKIGWHPSIVRRARGK